MNKTIGFIGGGNMAQALISGLLDSGVSAQQIMVSDLNDSIRAMLATKGIQTTTDAYEVINFSNAVVLAIKPQLFSAVLSPLKGQFDECLLISVAAGMSVDIISQLTGSENIVRAMPNTPALIQKGAAGLYANNQVSKADKNVAENILKTAGLTIWVENEEQMHAVTAVSGSAPAYFFYLMESMIAAGQSLGLSEEKAKQLTLQTALGASKMALSSEDSPSTLRDRVTSPNGTTHAAIEQFKADGFSDVVARGMQACVNRSKEMAEDKKDEPEVL